MAEERNAGGANTLIADNLGIWGNGRFGRFKEFGSLGKWEDLGDSKEILNERNGAI